MTVKLEKELERSSFDKSRRKAFRRRSPSLWQRIRACYLDRILSFQDQYPPIGQSLHFEGPVVVSTYLQGRGDPQRGVRIAANDRSYLDDWANSVSKHAVHGIVLHDCLSDRFIRSLALSNIEFIRCPYRSPLSTNDYRFFLFSQLSRTIIAPSMFATDISDVVLTDRALPKPMTNVYVGNTDLLFGQAGWFRGIADLAHQPSYDSLFDSLSEQPVANAGVFGGSVKSFRTLVNAVCMELLALARPAANLNMPAFNYVCYRDFADRLDFSEVSRFKQHEADRSDVCFIHK